MNGGDPALVLTPLGNPIRWWGNTMGYEKGWWVELGQHHIRWQAAVLYLRIGLPQCRRSNLKLMAIQVSRFRIPYYFLRLVSLLHVLLLLLSYFNLTLIPWVTGALLTPWSLILLKRVLCHVPGKQIFWVTSISFVMLPLHAQAVFRT
jgi:hypothetical protein